MGEEGSSLLRDFRTLFGPGATGGLTDEELLDRYEARRDEADAAFEGLVTRHGPMVQGVCRRVLRDPHDVDDAFQATFLILASRARTIRDRKSLGGWLARVALRVALRADAEARRRRESEQRAFGGGDRLSDSPERREIRAAVDEEVDRLPDRYREPVVLCYLEGLTHDEAAQQLRCPVGTIRSRLSRARGRLKARLARRGLAPDLAPLAALPLSKAAIEAATLAALRPSMASVAANFLKQGGMKSMLAHDLNRWILVLLAFGTATGAVTLIGASGGRGPSRPGQARAANGPSPRVDPKVDPVSTPPGPEDEGEARLNRVLREWQRRSAEWSSLDIRFAGEIRQPAWGAKKNTGRVVLSRAGRTMVEFAGSTGPGDATETVRYLWTEGTFHMVQPEQKIRSEWPIASKDRGRLPAALSLPFFWHRSVDALKARYKVSLLVDVQDIAPWRQPPSIVLNITPISRAGEGDFSTALLVLDAQTYLPRRWSLYTGKNGEVTHYRVTDAKVDPAIPEDVWQVPEPAGWKVRRYPGQGPRSRIEAWMIQAYSRSLDYLP